MPYTPEDPFGIAAEAPEFILSTLDNRLVELHCSDRREAGALVIVDVLNQILAELKAIRAHLEAA